MSDPLFPDERYFMHLALREAEAARAHRDVPIGAVIVRDGELLAAAHNERELRQDPTAHAEILALREAAQALGSWRVLGATLYVTLEPCAMCAGAIVLARVPRVVYGATDPKAGACGSVLDVLGDVRLNHRPEVISGLLASRLIARSRQAATERPGDCASPGGEDRRPAGSARAIAEDAVVNSKFRVIGDIGVVLKDGRSRGIRWA
jgi:tRNA(adenine34) deaminase